MTRFKFNKYWFIAGTIAFIIIFAILINETYEGALEETKRNHQQQQLEMVNTTAQGITYLLNHFYSDMRFLAIYPEIKNKNFTPSLSFIDKFLGNYQSSIVKTIFFIDSNGNIHYSAGERFPDWARENTMDLLKSFSNKVDNNFLISPIIRNEVAEQDSELIFVMLTPVSLSEYNLARNNEFVGYIMNFNSLVASYIKPLRLDKSDFAWVIDGTGRLVYHPKHQEMLFFSISDSTPECSECHSSFETQLSIIKADKPSTGEYSVIGNEPPKVMAYAPIEIQNQKWVLVISTLLPQITESIRDKFELFFILGFVILGVILFFSFLVYYMNTKRIRAEEAQSNLEQIQEYQEQLNQASKLASIGELVDTVAHEINTPAGIISAQADALILTEDTSEITKDTLNIIKKQTKRISEYTRSLLNYSQSMPHNPEKINMKELVNECVYLLAHRFRTKKINVSTNFTSEDLMVTVDRRQMEQVLINILNNAVDALNPFGEITLTLRKVRNEYDSDSGSEKERLLISIEDNGNGIADENIGKIFTPFFSTKSKSEGTGLGLAITKAIITRHKGKIDVVSKKDKGTIFHIFLPLNTDNNENRVER